MEINRTYDVPRDGFEVESATLHVPSESLVGSEGGSSLRNRINSFKRVGLDRLHGISHTVRERSSRARSQATRQMHTLQHNLSDRARTVRGSVSTKINDLKPVVRERAMRLREDMRENAGKWAGIAAGAGLVLGIGGRIMRHRMHDHALPGIVIIESTC